MSPVAVAGAGCGACGRAVRSTARVTWSSARFCAICQRLSVPSLPSVGSTSCPASSACSATVAAGARYHAEQGREQGPVRPVQSRAVCLPPLQDGELVAQDQDVGGLPCLLAPGQPQP
jgi:hypothetical protein